MEPGTKLGPYEITEQLGAGGMGEVRLDWCHSLAALLLAILLTTGCTGLDPGPSPLTAEVPLHLEEHFDVATIVGSEVPADAPDAMEWHFDEPQEDWKPVVPWNPTNDPVEVTQLDDALRVTLTDGTRNPNGNPRGGLVLEVPDWNYEDLAHLVVRARTSDDVSDFFIGFNRREGTGTDASGPNPFEHGGDEAPVVSDGTVQTYQLRLDYFWGDPPPEGSIREIGLLFAATDVASIDILSITLIPKVANYANAGAASRTEIRNRIYRQALYTHTPGRVEYRVKIPEAGRLDFAMGVLREDVPVTFRVTAIPDGAGGGEPTALFEERYAVKKGWGQRSVDLADFAGQTVTLGLEAESEAEGRVALWAAPTISGARTTDKPNIIFYIIDGGGADYMSVYGYNRRTTPNLERLAAEGAIFERAYSNSSWTRPSTASFMTSLQHSVLGGFKNGFNVIPDNAPTMAQHMHRAGYQTAVFTSNGNAGRLSSLERGVDVFREAGVTPESKSSVELHENFWAWREAYPSEPYWVHFQTTDVHRSHTPLPPFAGLFISPNRRQIVEEWHRLLQASGVFWRGGKGFEQAGISRVPFVTAQRDLHDETMAHQDYQLGRLMARLKAAGEWEHTLLIVAADHGVGAGSADYGLLMRDSLPPRGPLFHRLPGAPMVRSGTTRIPLIVVWPGRIAPGHRFSQPVSMIDLLPTILDLADLSMPEVMQGQSLAPLLLGEAGWEPRPVILDEFWVDGDTGEFRGRIEVVDGRWGASLEINPHPETPEEERRPVPLLLYDLWNDPHALSSLHEERPDLVEHYTAFLEAQFEAHQLLAQQFTPGEESPLTSEQLRTLRALGYIQ